MAIKGISSTGSTAYINRLNSQLSDLHVQLSTQKKAQTYGRLGNDRNIALKMRADIKSYSSYNDAIARANIHLSTVQNVLSSLGDIESNARADFNGTAMSLNDGSFRNVKIGAEQRLNDAISLLNEKIADKYLFSGTKLDEKPISSITNIMNGEGARAGLKQVISERKLADLGALDNGRLTIGTVGAQVNMAEDGVHAFGIKLGNVTQAISGLTVTGPVGAPAATAIDFTGATVIEDDLITIRLIMPDGAKVDINLMSKADGSNDKDGFVIGANDAATAANFQASLDAAIAYIANGEMLAGSTLMASDGFFAEPPQRVDGPPFDTAVAMMNGTDADTMSWYNGDKAPGGARSSYKVFASKNSVLEVGTRADEEPLREFVKNLSMMVASTFDPTSDESNEHYAGLKTRITKGLSDDNLKVGILDLSTELGYKEKHLENLSVRNTSRVFLSQNILADVEMSDTYEVSAMILTLNTQLEMSYKTTSLLSQTHLINFI